MKEKIKQLRDYAKQLIASLGGSSYNEGQRAAIRAIAESISLLADMFETLYNEEHE